MHVDACAQLLGAVPQMPKGSDSTGALIPLIMREGRTGTDERVHRVRTQAADPAAMEFME